MAVIASLALFVFASNADAQGVHDALVAKHATANSVPESLVRRVIRIESRGNPRAVSKGNYGLMQIRLGTARAMGYRGNAKGLLDPDINMTYAVKYLGGAYRAAGCNADRAIRYYQRGYHGVRRVRCPVPRPAATQSAGLSIEKRLTPQRVESSKPQSTGTGTGDVLKPKVVRTVSVPSFKEPSQKQVLAARPALRSAVATPLPNPRPKPMRVESNDEAKSDSIPVAAEPKPAAKPESISDQPKLAATSRPVGQEAAPNAATATAAVSSDAKPLPSPVVSEAEAKPAAEPPPQAVAKLEPEAVPLPPPRQADARPSEKKAKPVSRTASKRTRGRRQKADSPGLVTLLKKLVTPDKRPRTRSRARRRADNPSVYRHALN